MKLYVLLGAMLVLSVTSLSQEPAAARPNDLIQPVTLSVADHAAAQSTTPPAPVPKKQVTQPVTLPVAGKAAYEVADLGPGCWGCSMGGGYYCVCSSIKPVGICVPVGQCPAATGNGKIDLDRAETQKFLSRSRSSQAN